MERELRVESDEAYDLARELAERTGSSPSDVVLQALRAYKPRDIGLGEVAPAQAAETYRRLIEASKIVARHKFAGATSDHSDLYDNEGLPG